MFPRRGGSVRVFPLWGALPPLFAPGPSQPPLNREGSASPQDTRSTELPMERRIRHAIEIARAYSAWNRVDDALSTLLDAEQMAPEQVQYHMLSRQLVLTWIRNQRGRPSQALIDFARRLNVLGPAPAP